MNFCPNFSAWTFGQLETGYWCFSRARCKSWNCEYCATVNRNQWWHRIVDAGHMTTNQWTFATITAHPVAIKYQFSLRNLRQGWRKLLERMRRAFGKRQKWHYVRVYELTQIGAYHVHFIIDRVIPQRWLKDHSWKCWMGYMAHTRQFKWAEHEAYAGYVCKYMVKGDFKLEKGIRRIQASVKFPDNRWKSEGWEFVGRRLYKEDWRRRKSVGDIVDAQFGNVIGTDDFWDDGRYVLDNVSGLQ